MQNYLYSLFQSFKNSIKLCERRNNPKIALNPHAKRERTEIIVRKTSIKHQPPPQEIPPIAYPPIPQSQIPKDQSPQLLQQTQAPQVITKPLVKPSKYTLNICEPDYSPKSQPSTLQEQLITTQLNLDIQESQLTKAIAQIQFLKEKDQQRKKLFWKNVYINVANEKLDSDLSSIIDENQQPIQIGPSENELYEMYKRHIEDVRDLKYSKELKDYPKITYSEYSKIIHLWSSAKKNPNHLIKNMKLKILQKLIARSFRTLSFGIWLNDEIINAYLEMIDNKASEMGKKYKVLNSFFAKTTFSKSKEMISRALKRKNISNENQIIIAINNGNHWFFARIMNQKVIVYDSIPKDPCIYQSNDSTREIFHNIIEFSNWFYGGQHEIEVEQGYPTQNNGSDCGMFLLCGIKDIVRDYSGWSFNQGDISFKRVQVSKELLDEEITGFQC